MQDQYETLRLYASHATIGLQLYAKGDRLGELTQHGLESGLKFFELAALTPELESIRGASEYLSYASRLEKSLEWMKLAPSQFKRDSVERVQTYFADWIDMLSEAEKGVFRTEEVDLDVFPPELFDQATEHIGYREL